MKVQVAGSASNLGKLIVPALIEMGTEIISVGRKHNDLCNERNYWEFGMPFPINKDVDFIIFLSLDTFNIKLKKKFFSNNLLPLLDLINSIDNPSRIILPLSHSGFVGSKSRYGQLKFIHEKISVKHNLRTIKVGWVNSNSNGGKTTQKILSILKKFKFNLLPKKGCQEIYITEYKDIKKSLGALLTGSNKANAFNKKSINLVRLIYGTSEPRTFYFGVITNLLLQIIPIFYLFLPKTIVKSLDSARSLL